MGNRANGNWANGNWDIWELGQLGTELLKITTIVDDDNHNKSHIRWEEGLIPFWNLEIENELNSPQKCGLLSYTKDGWLIPSAHQLVTFSSFFVGMPRL